MLGRMGKLFGWPPHKYFDLDNDYVNLAIDMACASAHWEDENYHYKQAQEKAKEEADQIGGTLESFREQIQGQRG